MSLTLSELVNAHKLIKLEKEFIAIGSTVTKLVASSLTEYFVPDEADAAEAAGFIRQTIKEIEAGHISSSVKLNDWIDRSRPVLAEYAMLELARKRKDST